MGTNKLSDSVQSRRVMIARQTARWNAIVTEHRIISRIIHALTNHGAFNIARTSLPAWNYIWKDRTHWVELNRRIYCDGSGVRERKALLSKYSLPHIPCAAAHLTCSSSLRPCIRCGKIVCDDCRTHLLYQSFFESWSKPTNSRYPQCVLKLLQELGSVVTISSPPPKPVILDHEVAPFPPSFRGNIRETCGNVDAKGNKCRFRFGRNAHDILTTLVTHDGVRMEQVDGAIVKANEAKFTILRPLGWPTSWRQHDGVFTELIEKRVVYLCKLCAQKEFAKSFPGKKAKKCGCSLAKRFADAWICRKCSQAECKKDAANYDKFNTVRYLPQEGQPDIVLPRTCYCGSAFEKKAQWVKICTWCRGFIIENYEQKEELFWRGDQLDRRAIADARDDLRVHDGHGDETWESPAWG